MLLIKRLLKVSFRISAAFHLNSNCNSNLICIRHPIHPRLPIQLSIHLAWKIINTTKCFRMLLMTTVIYFFLSAFNFAVMWAEWTEPRTESVLRPRPLGGPSPKCWTELKFLYDLWLDRHTLLRQRILFFAYLFDKWILYFVNNILSVNSSVTTMPFPLVVSSNS